MNPALLARLQLVLAAVLFSTGGAAIKSCQLESTQIAASRSLIAAIFVFLAMPAARRGWTLKASGVAIAYGATMVFFVIANRLTTSANAIFLQDTAPLYVLLASPWLLKEQIKRTDIAVILLIAAGLLLFFFGEERPQSSAPNPFLGNAIAVTSGLTWAGTIIGLRYLRQAGGAGTNGAAPAIVLGNIFAFLVCGYSLLSIESLQRNDVLIILYLGVVQIGLAYVLVTRAVAHISALEASIILLLEPLMNPIWSFAMVGETPSRLAIFGGAIILVGTISKSAFDARTKPRANLKES